MFLTATKKTDVCITLSIDEDELENLLIIMDKAKLPDSWINPDGYKVYHDLYNRLSEVLGDQ